MNWGKGITIALVLFIGFIVALGTILMRQNVDLVAEDYYQQEIDYETQISAESNAKKLEKTPQITQDEDYFMVQIPEGDFKKVTVDLKRPNNSDKDLSFDILGTKSFLLEKSKLDEGQYQIILRYEFEGKPCQEKSMIYIKK